MVSKTTTQIGFRFPIRYIGLLDEVNKGNTLWRAELCRLILKCSYEHALDSERPTKKFLFYDKVKRERAQLSGASIVITVRLPHELATGIREMAERDGNNVSEWCGIAILRELC